MADLQKDLASILVPSNIDEALAASSPYVLRKAFARDPTIRRLIAAGEEAITLIDRQLHDAEDLDEITLAAFAYVVENVKAEAAPKVLGMAFIRTLENPGPFFIHFAAHAMRAGFRLPIKPLEMEYSLAELIETRNRLR